MLVEYLTGEIGGPDDHISASHISRLIIAGDSLADPKSVKKAEPSSAVTDNKKGVNTILLISSQAS
jgi:hypothetical protein